MQVVLQRQSADAEVETDSNQHDEDVAIDDTDEEELIVEEELSELTEIIPTTTTTRIIGVPEEFQAPQQLAPVEGVEGPDIDVAMLSSGMPYTDDEKMRMKRLNRYARTLPMIYKGGGWFQLGEVPRPRYVVKNSRAIIGLKELADTAYYYWRRSDTHAAGGFYQSLTKHETDRLQVSFQNNLCFKWLMEHHQPSF
jgi:hypothetical protein